MTTKQRTVVILPKFRVDFEYITKPREKDQNGNPLQSPIWECRAIFDPVAEMSPEDQQRWHKALAAAKAAKDAAYPPGTPVPANFRSPLKDGTRYNAEHGDKYPHYVGKTLVELKSKGFKVGLVDVNLNAILDPALFYSGCYAMAEGSWYTYNVSGNSGLSFGLNNVMKVMDGEPLGFKRDPANAFREIDTSAYRQDNSALFAAVGSTSGDELGI